LIGLSPDKFGIYNLIPPIGMVIGSFLVSTLIGRPVIKIIYWATIGSLIAVLTMLIPFAAWGPSTFSLFIPMALIFLAQAIGYANISSYGLSTAQNKSNASAVFNFLNISTIVVSVLLSEFIFPESALAMPLFFLFFFGLMLLLWTRLKKLAM
jgi:hypothetical protein